MTKENTQIEENKMADDLKNIEKEEKVKKCLEKSKLISFKSLHNPHLAFLHKHEEKIKVSVIVFLRFKPELLIF